MTERPIIFSAPMVRAILAGTKTQTRRVVNLKPWHQIEERDDGTPWLWMYDDDRATDHWVPCPYGQLGDRLWVREAIDALCGCDAAYVADGKRLVDAHHDGWDVWRDGRNLPYRTIRSIHMPRWASRITLEITGVRVERLQDISETDTVAEGIPAGEVSPDDAGRFAYRLLWESLHGLGSWDANPWVWVVEFKRITQKDPQS